MVSGDPGPLSWTNWQADGSIVVGSFVVCFAYVFLARRAGEDAPRPRQIVLFALAVASVLLALTSPLHDLSEHYLFSAHMVQHLLLMLVMPPLLLASVTPAMVSPLIADRRVEAVVRFFTRPVIAFAACNGIFLAFHLPQLYDLTLRSHSVHIVEHLLFMLTSLFLWWPLMSPLEEMPPLSYPLRLLYIFGQVLPGSLVGGVVANSANPLYQVYAAAPRIVDLTPVQDQQLGAIIMWVGGGTFWLAAFTVVFFIWASKDMADVQSRSASYPSARPGSGPRS